MSQHETRVGIGVFVVRDDGSFLMQHRQGSHGAGSWSVPGGHLEFGESWQQTAAREVKEETGLVISAPMELIAVTNDIFADEQKHYVTLWMKSRYAGGEPRITEPDKCIAQGWFTLDNLPSPLFLPWQNLPPFTELKKKLLAA